MTNKKLGVHGKDLPVRRSLSVDPANFLIGGLIGLFARSFNQAWLCYSADDVAAIFDGQVDPSTYGWDAVNGFFNNAAPQAASLYVVGHAGYTGSAIDAVSATAPVNDQNGTPQVILTLTDAYQGIKGYGVSANRTGYQIEYGDRFTTSVKTTGLAADTWVILNSVSDIYVGDMLKIIASGGTPATVYRVVTAVDQSTGKVSFATAMTPQIATAADVVTVPGFRIHTFRKSTTGIETEVNLNLGKTWLTIYPAVTKYYAPNVFGLLSSVQNGQSPWLAITVNSTTSPVGQNFPAAVAATVYLTGGAAGTAPTTASHWSNDLQLFNALPVRFLTNCETTVDAVHKAGETYCVGRVDDHPKWLPVLPEAQTKAQLINLGQNWQRGNEVDALLVGHWLLVTDPFNSNPAGAYRHVPPVGHIMGLICRSIGQNGIHYIPATKDMPLAGLQGISGTQFTDDQDRTDIANAGVNCLQFVQGYGYLLRNAFTPSTDSVYQFFNAIVMRDYIKVSAINSLQSSENKPTTYQRIVEDGYAIKMFCKNLWDKGSTGSVPQGETFGQGFRADGSPTQFSDAVDVTADMTNNSAASMAAGERYSSTYFCFPAPSGVITVGVGVMVRS